MTKWANTKVLFLFFFILWLEVGQAADPELKLISEETLSKSDDSSKVVKTYEVQSQPFIVVDTSTKYLNHEFHDVAVYRKGSKVRSAYSKYYCDRDEHSAKVSGYKKFDDFKGVGTFALLPLLEDKEILILRADLELSNFDEVATHLQTDHPSSEKLNKAIPSHSHFGRSASANGFELNPKETQTVNVGSVNVEFRRKPVVRGLARCLRPFETVGSFLLNAR